MGDIFIYIIFASVIFYDIFLLVREKRTITYFMREWYVQFVFVPFAVGVIFLGHFLDLIKIFEGNNWATIIGLCATGIPVLIISIIFHIKNIVLKHRACVLLFILGGYIAGDLFW